MTDLVERLRTTTALMASQCSAPMNLWQDHSTAVLQAATTLEDRAAEITRLRAEVEAQKEIVAVVLLMRENGKARVKELEAALEWYGEHAAGCRKIGSVGEPYRRALDADGGARAHAALRSRTEG